MGILDLFRKDDEHAKEAQKLPSEGLAGSATRLVERLLDVGIDGKGHFDSARTIADAARAKTSSAEKAIDVVVNEQLRLAAAGGFVTGLGGFVTLPVALPANVAGFYLIATRMAAAIAYLRGYDLQQKEVRSAVLLSLVGADSEDLLKKAGYASAGRLSSLAAQRLPGPVLMAVNKGVGFRLLTQVGKKSLARFGKGVPLLGGVLGAGLDGYMAKQIADHVRAEFPRRDPALAPA
ncbi:MAG: EcsC family protein [Austwickia sp.]|nr:EcsC family protein [Actinomycetota bacterium]MCB1252508.1 EcsC family protein [Austwickia sp.]MCO5310187.1 EcsC family protein [Austwickia sp.]